MQNLAEATIRKMLYSHGECIELRREDGEVVDISMAMLGLFGVRSKEEYHKRVAEFLPAVQPGGGDSWQVLQEFSAQVFGAEDGNNNVEFDFEYRNTAGDAMPCRIKLHSATYHGMKVACLIIKAINHAPTKDASDRIHDMLDSIPLGCWLFTTKGQVIDTNQHAVDIFEMGSKGEMNRASVADCVPAVQPNGENSVERFLRALAYANENGIYNGTMIARTKTGRDFATEMTMTRIEYGDGKAIIMSLRETNEDFELVRQMRSERVVRQRLQAMIDSSPLGIFIMDKNFSVSDCNQAVVKLFNFRDKAHCMESIFAVAKKYESTGDGGDQDGMLLLSKIQEAFSVGFASCEWEAKAITGENRPVEFTVVRITQDTDFAVIIYVRDLREQRKMIENMELAQQARVNVEIAEGRNLAKSKFLARMSHEIRTPISAVLGISEIQLRSEDLAQEVEDAFSKINTSASLLLEVANDILDLSRIEVGKMSLLYEEYDTVGMITDVIDINMVSMQDKSFKFVVDVDEHLPRTMVGDSLRVAQIITNLLSNAIKYTFQGKVELTIKGNDDMFYFTVKDTGLGMTKEQVDALREDYARFHEDKFRFVSGAGLGMSIVHSLVQLMQAKINIRSEVGVGTFVEVKIPQKSVGNQVIGAEIAENMRNISMSQRSTGTKEKFIPEPMPYGKVLVVDDIDANIYVAQGLLSFYGLEVETCTSGREAVDKVIAGSVYDIIFMDNMMPGLSGAETMSILRKMEYHHPIVVLTANAIIGQAEEFIRLGFDGFISKPIVARKLDAVLNKFVRDKQPPEVLEAAKNAAPKPKFVEYEYDDELVEKIKSDFISRYKNAMGDLNKLITAGENNDAHRLAHSLKSVAGLLKKNTLAEAAKAVEYAFDGDGLPTKQQLDTLEAEITSVLMGFGVTPGTSTKNDKIFELFDELRPLLQSRNVESIQLVDGLRHIPEAAILVKLVEEYDFSYAEKAMDALKIILEAEPH